MKRSFLACAGFLWLTSAACAQNVSQPAATTNRSVTITTGNTFQQVLAAGSRRSLTIENNNTNSDNCWITVDGGASPTKATAQILSPGGAYFRSFPYIPNGAIQATCVTTGDSLYVDFQ